MAELLKVQEATELQLYSSAVGAYDRNISCLFPLIYLFSQYLLSPYHLGTQDLGETFTDIDSAFMMLTSQLGGRHSRLLSIINEE